MSKGSRIAYDNRDAVIRKLKIRADIIGQDTANQAAQIARELAPKKTGFLAGTIQALKVGDEWTIRATAFYALFVELGTRYKAAHPFLFPALEAVRVQYVERIANLFKRK